MSRGALNRLAAVLALAAGGLDACTGLGLVAQPGPMLRLMGVPALTGDPVYVRFVGALVWAVGASYLWALARWRTSGEPGLLRATLELTVIFRLAAGGFSAWAIARGWLEPAWASVPATDFFLAVAQIWLLRQGALK